MKHPAVTIAAVVALVVGLYAQTSRPGAPSRSPFERGLRVEITLPASVRSEPVTGRVYVMVARTNDREPRLQIGRTGTPFFGRDVEKLRAGTGGHHRCTPTWGRRSPA